LGYCGCGTFDDWKVVRIAGHLQGVEVALPLAGETPPVEPCGGRAVVLEPHRLELELLEARGALGHPVPRQAGPRGPMNWT